MKIRRTEIGSPGSSPGQAHEPATVCDLTECFPDDADALLQAREDLLAFGVHYAGGGAAPVVKLERVYADAVSNYTRVAGSADPILWQRETPIGHHCVAGDEFGPSWEEE